MDHKKSRNTDHAMVAMITFLTLMGGAIRLIHPLFAAAPLNDGGLFYSMIMDLQKNGFMFPAYTSYNQDLIPFAYPPLALYFTGALAGISGWSVFDLIRILPPILSALTIPAFYMLAKEILRSKARTVIAVLIFTFIPRTFDWHVMGGGITRAPGFIFAILAIREFYLLFRTRQDRHIPMAILFSTLCAYTHPEATVHAALSAIIFYILMDRSLKGLGKSMLIAVGTLILSAPWWVTIVSQHGASVFLAPMTAAGQASLGLAGRVFTLVGFEFTDELFLNIAAILGLIGVAVTLVKKEYLLVLWLAFIYLIEPRGGSLYIMLPHAMLAAIAVHGLILPALGNRSTSAETDPGFEQDQNWPEDLLGGKAPKFILGYIFLYGIMSAFVILTLINSKYTLKPADLEAFSWARDNTPTESRYILLTHEVPLKDASSEWFPALTGRKSLATVFGQEWINDNGFAAKTAAYILLQKCSKQDETCLSDWSEETGESFDYVYIRKFKEDLRIDLPLIKYLSTSSNYELVYDTEGVAIFRLNQ